MLDEQVVLINASSIWLNFKSCLEKESWHETYCARSCFLALRLDCEGFLIESLEPSSVCSVILSSTITCKWWLALDGVKRLTPSVWPVSCRLIRYFPRLYDIPSQEISHLSDECDLFKDNLWFGRQVFRQDIMANLQPKGYVTCQPIKATL